VFQGPFQRGEIINGKLEVREILWQCMGCNKVGPLEAFKEEAFERPKASKED